MVGIITRFFHFPWFFENGPQNYEKVPQKLKENM